MSQAKTTHTITRRSALLGGAAALAAAATAPAAIKAALASEADAELLALCRAFHRAEDAVHQVRGRDIEDDDTAPADEAIRRIKASEPQTMQGLTAKVRAIARYEDDDPLWQALAADVERLAARIG